MKKLAPIVFLSSLILAVTSFAANAGKLAPGKIRPFQMKGDVSAQNIKTGEVIKLKRGQEVEQGVNIVTGAGSSALFLFSNGATINIGENSNVAIERYLQAPFDATKTGQFLMLKEDPSTSDTLIKLNHGELVGKVKKLKPDSFYDVETPIGSAGVRGTTFSVAFFIMKNGNYALKVGNLEGRVLLTTSMPSTVTVNDQNVGETNFDPTKTLSTGDVPQSSVITVIAKPGDVKGVVKEIMKNIPVKEKPASFKVEVTRMDELVQGAQNPEAPFVPGKTVKEQAEKGKEKEKEGEKPKEAEKPKEGEKPTDNNQKPQLPLEKPVLVPPSPAGGDLGGKAPAPKP